MGLRPGWSSIVLVSLVSAVFGCASSPTLDAARKGDFAALKDRISREQAACTLDAREARELAGAIADRELRQSREDQTSLRIEEARACAHQVSHSLAALARSEGDVGAAATLALLDAGERNGGEAEVRRYGASPNPLWRAVAARAAVGEELGVPRRAYYRDPDERVRLAALRAALEKGDRADTTALLDAARLDPNPVAQAIAARALGGIGSEEVVLGLRDLYARADESLRQSIVDGWGRAQAAHAGGLRELIRVAENDRGAPAIEAGWSLLRFGREEDAAAIGTRALVRAMGEGLPRDRVLAISAAPAGAPGVTEALRKAAAAPDAEVKVAALSELADVDSTYALAELQSLRQKGVRSAVYALAKLGDRSAAAEVAKDLASPQPNTRVAAARALVGMGDVPGASGLLADPDPHVRMTSACMILTSRN